MALVDIEEKYYPCPHCKGRIKVMVQYYYEGGASHTVYHIDENGGEKEIEEEKKDNKVSFRIHPRWELPPNLGRVV